MAQPSGKLPEIKPLTGLRAVAGWWVVLFHVYCSFQLAAFARAGDMAVDLFFILSGFIISYTYDAQFREFHWPQYGHFLRLRLARIYPVHMFMLLGLLAVVLVGPRLHVNVITPGNYTAGAFARNVLMVHAWNVPITASWNGPSWSISCEWLAYLLYPVLPLLLMRLEDKRLVVVLIGMLLLGLLVGFALSGLQTPFEFAVGRIATEFPAGCLLFRLYQLRGGAYARWNIWVPLALVIAIFGGGYLSLPVVGRMWVVLAFPVIVLGLAEAKGLWARILSSRIALFWGRASYSLYMVHQLCVSSMRRLLPRVSGSPVLLMATGVATILMAGIAAVIVYSFVELPFRHFVATGSFSNRKRQVKK